MDGDEFETIKEAAKGELQAQPVIIKLVGRINCTSGAAI